MSRIKNFWNKVNSNWLAKNKDNINLNWRPRKWIALVNEELKEAGYTPATKMDIEANYMAMLQLPQDELVKIWRDKDKPMLIRILARNMLWWKGFDIIEKMLDRWIWKTTQTVDNKHSWSLTLTDWLIAIAKNPQKDEF